MYSNIGTIDQNNDLFANVLIDLLKTHLSIELDALPQAGALPYLTLA